MAHCGLREGIGRLSAGVMRHCDGPSGHVALSHPGAPSADNPHRGRRRGDYADRDDRGRHQDPQYTRTPTSLWPRPRRKLTGVALVRSRTRRIRKPELSQYEAHDIGRKVVVRLAALLAICLSGPAIAQSTRSHIEHVKAMEGKSDDDRARYVVSVLKTMRAFGGQALLAVRGAPRCLDDHRLSNDKVNANQ